MRTMTFTRPLLPGVLALAAGVACAQGDPLKSTACGDAIGQLQAARADKGASGARIESLRAAASTTCLGAPNPPVRPGRVLQAPVVVPPPRIDVPVRAAPLPPLAPLPPPVAIDRPPQPAVCDAGGCWANDGTHLQHVPPTLTSPGGVCSLQGGLVYCP
jgi:hypothetical protein